MRENIWRYRNWRNKNYAEEKEQIFLSLSKVVLALKEPEELEKVSSQRKLDVTMLLRRY